MSGLSNFLARGIYVLVVRYSMASCIHEVVTDPARRKVWEGGR